MDWQIKDLKSKAARGIYSGDVANSSVRKFLREIGDSYSEKIDETYLQEALEFFKYKCPYTGKDLRKLSKDQIVIDHIVPINKDYCGLNVRGNLVLVDKTANNKKGGKSIEEYFGKYKVKDSKQKLAKIKQFQKKYKYNPEKIKEILQPQIQKSYSDITKFVNKIGNDLSSKYADKLENLK